MKALILVSSILLVNAPIAIKSLSFIGQPEVKAGQTCTTNGKEWECKDDGQGSSKPSCVGKGPFECSEPAPAGFIPLLSEFVPSSDGTDTNPPSGGGSGSRT